MEATAKATYVRISPRKVQIVLDLIRNQPVDKAMANTYNANTVIPVIISFFILTLPFLLICILPMNLFLS